MNWLNRSLISGPHLILCLTEEDYRNAMSACAIEYPGMPVTPGAHATTHILVNVNGRLAAVVALSDWKDQDPITVSGILVHEAVHVFQEFCDHIGEKAPSVEFEAYSIQSIYQELASAFVFQTGGADNAPFRPNDPTETP